MTLSISRDMTSYDRDTDALHLSLFPSHGLLETTEQIRRFELLRLAFFVLKLRKLEQRIASEQTPLEGSHEFHRSLLRHVIFQQVLTLIQLDARKQALQVIEACQN